jgi:hypothetical protein
MLRETLSESSERDEDRASLRLSDAFSLGTFREVRNQNEKLADVLCPSRANLERLLRWHAERTAVSREESYYADIFTRAAKSVIECKFEQAAAVLASMRVDSRIATGRVAADRGVQKLQTIVDTFRGEVVHPRNLYEGLFVDLVRSRTGE